MQFVDILARQEVLIGQALHFVIGQVLRSSILVVIVIIMVAALLLRLILVCLALLA